MKATHSQRLMDIERKARSLKARLESLEDEWIKLSDAMKATGSTDDVDNIVPSEWTCHCVSNDLGNYRFRDVLA